MEYRTLTLVDSRICHRCGARAGKCEHLEAVPGELHVPQNDMGRAPSFMWNKDELETLAWYFEQGHSAARIADLMNKTQGAINGQIFRLGLRRAA